MSAHSNSGINPIAKAKTRAAIFLAAAALIFSAPAARAQQSPKPPQGAAPQNPGSMPGMDMNDMQHDADQNPEAARDANDAMSGHDMDMGGMDMNPHMFMTELQPKQPGDAQRAEEIVEILGKSIAKYKDYRVALADGYRIFLPNYPQKQYHFTNYHNAFVAGFVFNPAHPTSLLYTKTKDGYELQGAMFTAPKSATEQQLNERVPLSVARWHEHVNFCLAPRGATAQQLERIRPRRLHRHPGRLRPGRRPLDQANLRLDGPRLPLRDRPRQSLGALNSRGFCLRSARL